MKLVAITVVGVWVVGYLLLVFAPDMDSIGF